MQQTLIKVNPSSSWSWAWPSSAPACFRCFLKNVDPPPLDQIRTFFNSRTYCSDIFQPIPPNGISPNFLDKNSDASTNLTKERVPSKKCGKSPKGGEEGHCRKSKSPKFKIWTFWDEVGGGPDFQVFPNANASVEKKISLFYSDFPNFPYFPNHPGGGGIKKIMDFFPFLWHFFITTLVSWPDLDRAQIIIM